MSENNTLWTGFITPFAQAIGKDAGAVSESLKTLIGEPTDDSVELLGNEEFVSYDDLKNAIGEGVPPAVLKKAVKDHLRKTAPSTTAASANLATASFDILPPAPADDEWLRTLKTGGELKVNTNTVVTAIRAALAGRTGLFDLPAQLVQKMEAHAESLDEPVSGDFFKLRKLLTRRSYSEIFAALEVEGAFATQQRKDRLMDRLSTTLWPALASFQGQLKGWADSWQQGYANPGLMVAAFTSIAGGGGALPPGMMQPPPTETLRDGAEGVVDQINKVFAGTGIPVAMALAYDAQKIKEVIENPILPSQLGAANRDQMLKMLNASVSADYVRLERNVTRYALAIMELSKVTGGQQELAYLTALLMLGSQIPWEKLITTVRRAPRTASSYRGNRGLAGELEVESDLEEEDRNR